MQPPYAAPICSPHLQPPICSPICSRPYAATICSPPYAATICSPPYAAPICSPHLQPPSATPICNPHLQPPSAAPICNTYPHPCLHTTSSTPQSNSVLMHAVEQFKQRGSFQSHHQGGAVVAVTPRLSRSKQPSPAPPTLQIGLVPVVSDSPFCLLLNFA